MNIKEYIDSKKKKRNKYNVDISDKGKRDRTYTSVQGFTKCYDSLGEKLWAVELDQKIKMGFVRWWMPQPKVFLGDDTWTVDFIVAFTFSYLKKACLIQYHEVKGRETADFKRKLKIWNKYIPEPLMVLKRKGNKFETMYLLDGK